MDDSELSSNLPNCKAAASEQPECTSQYMRSVKTRQRRKWVNFKRTRNIKGQVMIMVAMLAVTFMFFFKFVVDTGILVVAKINIQNAADLAAYSGSASQARLMNQIGFLNYDMRRAYKKFLFRYYVFGTFLQDSFPKTPTTTSKVREFKPKAAPKGPLNPDYRAPVVCIDYRNLIGSGGQANLCKESEVSAPSSGGGSNSPVGQVYKEFIKKLAKQQQEKCSMLGGDNSVTLMNWLFNGDPENTDLKKLSDNAYSLSASDVQARQLQNVIQIMLRVSDGMGLIPKLLINKLRINTLNDYLNEPAHDRGVTYDEMGILQGEQDPAKNERVISAFYSAYHTLGSHLFDNQSVQLDELSPSGGKYFDLQTITHNFTTYFMDAQPASSGCILVPTMLNVANAPIGVAKDPSYLTYYAVRLKANAKLIYWPSQQFELKAYAAARPFGGFLGPPQKFFDGTQPSNFFLPAINNEPQKRCPDKTNGGVNAVADPNYQLVDNTNCSGFKYLAGGSNAGQPLPDGQPYPVPNLAVGDPLTDKLGFFDESYQYQLAKGMLVGNEWDLSQAAVERIDHAFQIAQAPNRSEKNLYLIPNDLGETETLSTSMSHMHLTGGDPFMHYFHRLSPPPGKTRPRYVHHFWAPLTSSNDPAQLNLAVDEALNQLTSSSRPSKSLPPAAQKQAQAMIDTIRDSITGYVATKLGDPAGKGENDETLNIAAIEDPLGFTNAPAAASAPDSYPNPPSSVLTPDTTTQSFWMATPQDIRTSWVTDKDTDIQNAGRVGYSVKFVTFRSLYSPPGGSGSPDGKGAAVINPLRVDAEAQIDKVDSAPLMH